MKLTKRPGEERGRTTTGWLDSRHSFSFGAYQDPRHVRFRSLRVINDDLVEPSGGFGEHGHRDAEIFSYVLQGRLEHRDSMGNGRILGAGEIQYMSAGKGVLHSEFNPSEDETVRFLQVWILPNRLGGPPRYEDRKVPPAPGDSRLSLLLAPDARDGAIGLLAEALVFLGRLVPGRPLAHRLDPGRAVWLHVIAGEVRVGGEALGPGDGASIEDAADLRFEAGAPAEFLLFDLGPPGASAG